MEGYGALLLEKPIKTVAVADLHLGFEEELRSKGIKVPLQSPKIIDELLDLISRTQAKKLVVVGDLKHAVPGPSLLEFEIIPKLLKPLKTVVDEIVVVPGNHDGKIGKVLQGIAEVKPAKGFIVEEERIAFTHGHVKPDKSILSMDVVVMGHLHPVLKIGTGVTAARLGVWLKLKGNRRKAAEALYGREAANLEGEITLLIMPSFNKILQGRSVTELSESAIVRGPLLRTKAFNLSEAEIFGIDGTYLGTLKELRDALP
ncbi:MAG: metallophosphoesterase [Candidatus Caldarchaeum sp.]